MCGEGQWVDIGREKVREFSDWREEGIVDEVRGTLGDGIKGIESHAAAQGSVDGAGIFRARAKVSRGGDEEDVTGGKGGDIGSFEQ